MGRRHARLRQARICRAVVRRTRSKLSATGTVPRRRPRRLMPRRRARRHPACLPRSILSSRRRASAARFPFITRRRCCELQKLARGYRNLNLKVLFKDGDALITRARASLISQFLDDPGATHLSVYRCRHRLRARTGLAADRVLAPICARRSIRSSGSIGTR